MSHAVQGCPQQTGHSEEFWQNVIHWRKDMENHSSIPARRTPWTIWKGKNIWHWKMSPSGQKVSNMLLGKSGGQLAIAPERMKQLGQSRNDAQLWVCLVVKFLCYKEQYCIGTWNVRSMNQGKLDMVKQARVNIDILGINDLKWTGMGEFNSDDHYTCLQCRRSWVRKILWSRKRQPTPVFLSG